MMIRPIQYSDHDTVREIFGAHLTEDGVEERMEEVRASHEEDRMHGWVIIADDEVIGCMMLEQFDDIDDVLARPVPLEIDRAKAIVKNGYLRPGYIGQGYGSQLFEHVLEQARERGIEVLIAEAWIRDGHRDAIPMLDSHGFEEVFTDDPYWPPTDHCPDCGKLTGSETCSCDGAVYMKELDV